MPHRSDLERAAAIAVRTLHLGAVVALGAALLGAPVSHPAAGWVVTLSGLALLAMDLAARRMRLDELAGAVVVAKLLAVGWVGLAGGATAWQHAVFWTVLVASSASAHAPKALRHWRPGRPSSSVGRPG
jgi:hypothetical protein